MLLYHTVEPHTLELLKRLMSLIYFEDAEHQFMPKMFADVAWEDIKDTLRKAVAEVSK